MTIESGRDSAGQQGLEHKLQAFDDLVSWFPQYLDVLAVRLDAHERTRVVSEIESGLNALRTSGYSELAEVMESQYNGVLLAELERENPKYTIH